MVFCIDPNEGRIHDLQGAHVNNYTTDAVSNITQRKKVVFLQ